MEKDKFNRNLTLILIAIVMTFFLVIMPKNAYAEINPNQVASDYSMELWEMWTHDTANSQKMTYMDYRAITNKASNQYKFQQRDDVWVDEYGFLVQNSEWYVVAMGSYWGKIGDKFIIHLENGEIISCVLGDIKSDRHTDRQNYAHERDGHVVEFLIDSGSSYMKEVGMVKHGLVNKVFKQWDSKIVGICKVKETWR